MGGDTRLAVIRTSTPGNRRLIILKDSFGNTLPGYLFYSFSEIHVIDSRYFTKNMKAYVTENKITDILFANNIFKAYSSHIYGAYLRFLSQTGHAARTPDASTAGRVGKTSHTTGTTHTAAPKQTATPHTTGSESTKNSATPNEGAKTTAAPTGTSHLSSSSSEHKPATPVQKAPVEKKTED